MSKKDLRKLSLWSIISSAIIFVINYFFYHYVTDFGIGLEFQEVAQKPFVADLIGQFGVLMLFFSVVTFMISFVVKDEK